MAWPASLNESHALAEHEVLLKPLESDTFLKAQVRTLAEQPVVHLRVGRPQLLEPEIDWPAAT